MLSHVARETRTEKNETASQKHNCKEALCLLFLKRGGVEFRTRTVEKSRRKWVSARFKPKNIRVEIHRLNP